MKTAENTLNSCGLILTDFVSSSNYDAVIYAMKLYANAKLEEAAEKARAFLDPNDIPLVAKGTILSLKDKV
ncbi:MAG: hypothetical protein EOO85_18450 [Pedobacter sp.]|nr:MAG: hypothetical protein EOO85_18450 [Pedobacter sp.]